MTKYRLTKYDYALLHPLMTPSEIKEEFGDRCGSIRGIYKALAKVCDKTAKHERDRLLNTFLENRKITEGEEEVKGLLNRAMGEAKIFLLAEIWERIQLYERRLS